jgi:cytochrome c biogenesis protein CcmG/thiol:disulfide interchange protein DsbE
MRRVLWALVLAVPLTGLLAFGFSRDPNAPVSPLLGKSAPGFRLESIDGKPIALSTLRGRPVVLNFWASWCVGCRQEHAYLAQAWRRYGPRGVAFVGIVFNDGSGAARDFMRQWGGGWPSLSDPGQQTAVDYGVAQIPETFIMDRSGVVRLKSAGPITPAGPVTPAIFERELAQLVGRKTA